MKGGEEDGITLLMKALLIQLSDLDVLLQEVFQS